MRTHPLPSLKFCLCLLVMFAAGPLRGDDPQPKPENTISVKPEAVKPQTFAAPVKFFVDKVVDRSGRPRPMLILEERGGVFIDREPVAIVREALETSLQSADLLAPDKTSATHVLDVYVFHFGLGKGSGSEYFGKVDLNVVVKNAATGKTETVTAMGTAVQGAAILKRNIIKNIQANVQAALQDAMRNFLRGAKLRDALNTLSEAPAAPAAPTGNPPRR